ncbi:MAG: alkaline phosphatase family protein [Planctomycetota bacterium]|nr:hypothetical protein [Planctomycetota bacterium]MDP6410631.1 alkaline phosphatase family protein [Planctomycetota bacterium]MDP6540903.1 alkaline phosphatase family protein [Planctomycetota bacterium]
MSDRVLVFIDALPYGECERVREAVGALRFARPVQPGFGYSVNVKSELFAGLSPDDAGFLNEWTHRPDAGFLRLPFARLLERLAPGGSLPGRVLRRVLGRASGENLRNIPLHLLAHLDRWGENAYERGYSHPNLFTELGVERFLYSEHGGDEGALGALLAHLAVAPPGARAFLANAHLDHVMHADGLDTPAFEAALEEVSRSLRAIWAALEERGNDPALCVVSDHGMAAVERTVEVDLERAFSGAGRRFGYFVDATMLRVWCDEAALLGELRGHLEFLDLPGRILAPQERRRWGVSSEEFGDLLLLLDEGVMFAPSFMGRAAAAAMHGYLPSLASQEGLLCGSEPLAVSGAEGALEALAVHSALRAHFEGAAADPSR